MGVLSLCEEAPSKVFGVPLSHLRKTGQMRQGLPLAFTHLVRFLEKHGLSTRGLFRVGGTVLRQYELRKCFDRGGFPKMSIEDVHSSAYVLKHFLRTLPGGLIPEPFMFELLKVFRMFRLSKRHKAVKKVLDTLPEENYNILCFLTFFLSRVAAESHANCMTTTNLSIEFGPILFHVPQGPTKLEEEEMCISFTEYMLDNLRHLLPNMYPQASATNTAEGDSVSEAGGDFTPEKCVQQVLLTETSSKPLKIGRLGRLRRQFLHFWQKFGSCNGRRKVEESEKPSAAGDVQCMSP
ncbi:rho GTPase-activating protein 1 isoform X1 [Danio rerio]|uniref:Rho GTPase-activating protein 1 isoform X1 n=1 Tax=Danio rerio TaxID=7955 RepID=A0AB32TCK6_DANRE